MRHRCSDAASERLDKRQSRRDSIAMAGGKGLNTHDWVSSKMARRPAADEKPIAQR
jgi:hypothetical protein